MENEKREVERGQILRYLALARTRTATPEALRRFLFRRLMPVSRCAMDFHLEYLEARGYVELVRERTDDSAPESIMGAKITISGIDRVDRRAKDNDGVAL